MKVAPTTYAERALPLNVRMRSLCIASFIIFLSWFLVEVNSQTFPYVSFMGQILANHSYVDLSLVGRPDIPLDNQNYGDSVECHTDLTTCCTSSDGVHRGDWYFPNGARLPFPQSIGFYQARDSQRVDLRRNYDGLTSGIYHCDIQTTVEPPKRGHFGNGTFVLSSEVVLFSEVV